MFDKTVAKIKRSAEPKGLTTLTLQTNSSGHGLCKNAMSCLSFVLYPMDRRAACNQRV